jgi:hypothetical protein
MGDLIHRIGDGYIGIETQDWPVDPKVDAEMDRILHFVLERQAEAFARLPSPRVIKSKLAQPD